MSYALGNRFPLMDSLTNFSWKKVVLPRKPKDLLKNEKRECIRGIGNLHDQFH